MPVPIGQTRDSSLLVLLWVALSLALLAIDYAVGPVIQVSLLFIIPVSMAAWTSGRKYGVALGAALTLARLYFATVLDPPWTPMESVINAGIRFAVLGSYAVLVDRFHHSLRLATEVEILKGLLPICSFCRKIRDEREAWQPLEQYVAQRSAADFTQSVCPECARQYYGETFDRR